MKIGPKSKPTELPRLTRAIRVVLTGGPGAGKTLIATQLAAQHPDQVLAIPEAATQVYQALQTRWDLLDDAGRRDVQRRIYQLQLEQEQRLLQKGEDRIILLDRGTVDGSAYWPGGPDDYWRDLGTSEEAELNRYDAVIWLQTCAALGLYDGTASNPCRAEAPEQAILTGQQLARAWFRHPRIYRIDAYPTIEEKVEMVRRVIGTIAKRIGA